jgi:hypothetical protein
MAFPAPRACIYTTWTFSTHPALTTLRRRFSGELRLSAGSDIQQLEGQRFLERCMSRDGASLGPSDPCSDSCLTMGRLRNVAWQACFPRAEPPTAHGPHSSASGCPVWCYYSSSKETAMLFGCRSLSFPVVGALHDSGRPTLLSRSSPFRLGAASAHQRDISSARRS